MDLETNNQSINAFGVIRIRNLIRCGATCIPLATFLIVGKKTKSYGTSDIFLGGGGCSPVFVGFSDETGFVPKVDTFC